MLRSLVAAVIGYAVLFAIVFAGVGIAWLALGGAGAFRGEGPEPSVPWLVLNLMSGLIAAVIGGLVARRIGRSQQAVRILVAIVLVLGLFTAIVTGLARKEPGEADKPVAEMGFFEAGQYAQQPVWYNWVIPLVGGAGVLLGGRERS